MAGKHLSSPHHSPNPYIIRCNPSIHMISYHVSSVFVWLWHFATAPLDTSGCSSAVSLLPHCSFLSSSFCGLNNQLLDGHSIHTSGRISMMIFVLFLIGSCHWSNIILNEYSFLPCEIKWSIHKPMLMYQDIPWGRTFAQSLIGGLVTLGLV